MNEIATKTIPNTKDFMFHIPDEQLSAMVADAPCWRPREPSGIMDQMSTSEERIVEFSGRWPGRSLAMPFCCAATVVNPHVAF
jgi:hypothetical protein